MGWRKQDKQTQKLFENVTKSLLNQGVRNDGIVRDDKGRIVAEIPLKEEYPVAKAYIAATAPFKAIGTGIAKGLGWVGEKMMPSALLKGIGQTFPKLAKVTTAISPYADAGLLATWGAQGIQEAKEAAKSRDAAGAIAGASMAALPLMGINPEVVQELKSSQKVNNIARALNREIKGTEIVDSPVTQNILAGKLGWAPRQNKVIWHNSETPISKLESTFPAWDIVKRDAPLGHVWGTGTETRQGFIGARPFHLRSTKPVEMNKPMVQLNESVGNGKNAVRNEILKFADQSGADAVNFSNIKDNTLSNQDVYAVFKDVEVKPKLSEAERLGIPKGERSNPKALEDPQYWGYQQWNDRYNSAVEAGDVEEGRRLFNLHEAKNAPDTKVKGDQFHGTDNREFNEMDSTKNPGRTVGAGSKLSNFFSDVDTANAYLIDAQGMGTAYNGPGRIIRARLNIKNPYIFDYEGAKFNGTGGSAKKYNYLTKTFTDVQNSQLKYFPTESDFIKQWRSKNKYLGNVVNGKDYVYTESKVKPTIAELVDNIDRNVYDGAIIKNITELNTPIVDYVTFTPNQVKLSNVITYDDYGNMIPIVKRHNYHIKDMRYKQGGILKAQKGKVLKLVPKLKSLRPVAKYSRDFSGVENLSKEAIGFGGVRPNLGLQALETEKRAQELLHSFDEATKRDAFLKERLGKVWSELTPTEQYWAKVRFKEYWDK